jgi:cyclopropane fatty-acyl-phospholipid synthase-like methyltransferase
MTDSDSKPDPEQKRIPLPVRLEAWWNGYDPSELLAYKLTQSGQDGASGLGPADGHKDFVTRDVETEAEVDDDDPLWPDSRIDVVQRLFGRGFIVPGGAERMAEICKPFGLTSDESVLDVSAGLGGGPSALAEFFGSRVTGYEFRPKLVAAAPGAIKGLKGASKVKLEGYDATAFAPPPKSADCVLSRDSLHLIADKVGMLDGMKDAIKDIGQLLITDYVTETSDVPSGRAKTWIEESDEPISLWSVERYQQALGDRGLDVRIVEDLSPLYAETIKSAFAAFVAAAGQAAKDGKGGGAGVFSGKPRRQAALIREVETWARRAAMLEAGEIKAYRFFALKRM